MKPRPIKATRNKIAIVRLTRWEELAITENAEKFCGGNCSAWIRTAAVAYRPTTADLEPLEPDNPESLKRIELN